MPRHALPRSISVALVAAVVAASCSGSEVDEADDEAADVSPPTVQAEQPSDSAPPESPAEPSDDSVPVATAAPETEALADVDADVEDGDEPEPQYMSGDSDYLFDQEQLHTFEINLPADALAELDADPAAEEYVEGSLTFDGETIEPIGVRYKGSVGAFVFCTDSPNPLDPSGAKTCTKLSIKLKINWDDPDAEFYDVRKVQLHSQNLDSTKMHERLGYWLFREMGVPAPRSTHARVVVNGEYLGVFALTEQIDGRFTRENFEDGTGNLYKEIWPFDSDGQPQGNDAFLEGLKTNEDEDPTTDIIRSFAEELASAGGADALAVIDRRTDIETMLRAFVVDRAIGNDDGALHWYCGSITGVGDGGCNPHNFYWYEDPSSEEVHFIPWDLDNSFDVLNTTGFAGAVIRIADRWGETSNDCEPFPFGPLNLTQFSAACDPLIAALSSLDDDFDRIRTELVDGPMSAERVQAQLDTWTEQIADAVLEEAAAHDDAVTVAEWTSSVDALITAIDAARETDGR